MDTPIIKLIEAENAPIIELTEAERRVVVVAEPFHPIAMLVEVRNYLTENYNDEFANYDLHQIAELLTPFDEWCEEQWESGAINIERRFIKLFNWNEYARMLSHEGAIDSFWVRDKDEDDEYQRASFTAEAGEGFKGICESFVILTHKIEDALEEARRRAPGKDGCESPITTSFPVEAGM